jgi:hypothetical protein
LGALVGSGDGLLTVNGTYLTEAHLVAKLQAGYTAQASFWGSELKHDNWGWDIVNGTCGGRRFKFGKRGTQKCLELSMSMGHSAATFVLPDWTVKVSADHVYNRISGPEHRPAVQMRIHRSPSLEHRHDPCTR